MNIIINRFIITFIIYQHGGYYEIIQKNYFMFIIHMYLFANYSPFFYRISLYFKQYCFF